MVNKPSKFCWFLLQAWKCPHSGGSAVAKLGENWEEVRWGQEMWKWTMTFARVVASWDVWSWLSQYPSALQDAEPAPLEHGICASGREHGAYCECWWLVVFLRVARAGCPHSAAAGAPCECSSVERLPQKPNSSIRELGEISGAACCDPDKTRAAERKNPAFVLVKDGPNPALKPLGGGKRPLGLALVSHWSHTLGSSWSQWHPQPGLEHLPRRKIPRESQTWTSQQIKRNATEPRAWCETSFWPDETQFPQPGFKEQYHTEIDTLC